MEDAASILVIILSVVLSIFLIVGVVLLLLVIKFIKQLRELAGKAEHAVETVEHAGELLKNTSGPVAILRFVQSMVKKSKKGK